jgi:hypothetical protein
MRKPTQRELAEKALAEGQQHESAANSVAYDDPFVSEDEAAAYYDTSVRTLQRWRQQGGGPRYTKLGHLVRYRRSWLEAHAEKMARTSTST